MYVVTVLFMLDTENRDHFENLILQNAAKSLRESGCVQFDVCFTGDGRSCFLYEVYRDQQAFEEHLKTPHFAEFNDASQSLILSKKIDTYLLAGNPFAHA